MGTLAPPSLAVACVSGGFEGVFVHGVLSAFAASRVLADAYAGASSSVLPTAAAAAGLAGAMGVDHWQGALRTLRQARGGMSEVVLRSIATHGPVPRDRLFRAGMPRLCIGASAVATAEGAEQTQGDGARRLGRRLLVSAARGDRSWVNEHLTARVFDTAASDDALCLTPANFGAVAYASTRMLHAWDVPAWVAGRPYVDTSYTCACPAVEMVRRGYGAVVAIATDPGVLYRDIFRTDPIPEGWEGVPIRVVRPEGDPKELGVDFTGATEQGLLAVYRHGEERGRQFTRDYVSRRRRP